MTWGKQFLAILLIWLTVSSAALATSVVRSVKAYQMKGFVRITLLLDSHVSYHYFMLNDPARLVVDLDQSALATSAVLPAFRHVAWISGMRSSVSKGVTRLVVDMSTYPNVKQSSIKLKSGAEKLVFDIYPDTSTPITASGQATPEDRTPLTDTSAEGALEDVVVVIDPGHGGSDPGAVGVGGVREKNVVLAIGKRLKTMIDAEPGMKASMTRDGDYFVSLRGRLKIARNDHADVFVAIHADKFKDARARGATVFALSQRGATSEAAHWLAHKENISELMGGVELDDKSSALQSVLLNLSQNSTISRSLKLGSYVLHDLDSITKLHHSHVDQARFVVLKSPDIPSVLVETGYLSNSSEARQLSETWYQKKMAYAIFQGIKQYVYTFPPPNTKILAWTREGGVSYTVKKGDSLSKIAAVHGVTVAEIKKKNNLKNDNVYVGQALKI